MVNHGREKRNPESILARVYLAILNQILPDSLSWLAKWHHLVEKRHFMAPSLRTLFLIIATAVLAGCASTGPRYQTAYHYEPPVTAEGRTCLEKCGQQMEACQQRCTADYQACLKRIEPQAEERYGEALKRYEAERDRYRWELERYQLDQILSWRTPFWYGPGFYRPWPGPYYPYYFPPVPPTKPSRDEEFNRLRNEQCGVECGCQPIYDACFLACGGKRTVEERCIANCPQ